MAGEQGCGVSPDQLEGLHVKKLVKLNTNYEGVVTKKAVFKKIELSEGHQTKKKEKKKQNGEKRGKWRIKYKAMALITAEL